MKFRLEFFSFVLISLILAACTSGEDKSRELVSSFAKAISDSDSTAIVNTYPASKDFLKLIDKIGEVEILSIANEKDKFTVKTKSSFYDQNSRFVQRDIVFYIEKGKSGYFIKSSKGLVHTPSELGDYPIKIGAVSQYSNDAEIGVALPDIIACFYTDCLSHSWRLNRGIERLNWSWETDWGTPHGNCTVKNTLPFTVRNVKYKITYYNGDNVVGADDGTVAISLASGETKSFSFYSSGVNGYKARSANITFEVPERYAMEWAMEEANPETYQTYKAARGVAESAN